MNFDKDYFWFLTETNDEYFMALKKNLSQALSNIFFYWSGL